jgi:hypothetical protein
VSTRSTARAARRARWAAAALALAAGLFATTQAALGLAVDGHAGRLRDPLYSGKLARLRALAAAARGGPTPLTVVMLGSSRVGYGFDARRFARHSDVGRPVIAANFGVPGAGPVTQALYARRLLGEGPRPEVVLLEVLPRMFAATPDGVPGEFGPSLAIRMRASELDVLRSYGYPEAALRTAWWEATLSPTFARRFSLMSMFSPSSVRGEMRDDWSWTSDPAGWNPSQARRIDPRAKADAVERSRVEYEQPLAGLSDGLEPNACRALADTLALLRREGVRAAVVVMPEASVMRGWTPPDGDALLRAWLTQLATNANVPFIDAREWVDDDGFLDAHHLLQSGAAVFTDRLAAEAAPVLTGAGG